jgi:hypothetical protein
MPRTNQSQDVTRAGLMAKGIAAHQDILAGKEIDEVFAETLQKEADDCTSLNQEQEAIKARLKTKTTECNLAFTAMRKRTAEAKKIVKMYVPKDLWIEFGIEDKR